MKKRNKIIMIIISIVMILSAIAIPTFAASFQQSNNINGTISDQISSPFSDVGKGNMSIVIEAQGVTYIGDLPQSFTGVSKSFVNSLKNATDSTPTLVSNSSSGIIQCSQVGNTLNNISFRYTSQYTYNRETHILTHNVYFNFVNNGYQIIQGIDKATIIIKDAFTRQTTDHWLSAVYISRYTEKELYENAKLMQPPRYKYYGCAQYTTGRDQYGRVETSIRGDMWVPQVLSAGTQTVRYMYSYGTDIYDIRTGNIVSNVPYGYVKYNEIPLYNPNDLSYIVYFEQTEVDPDTFQPMQISDEVNVERFFDEALLTTNITSETVDVGDSLVSWLANSVEGMFNFQIAPGISIGAILSIIVVLGLFIFLIKVFMGG